MGLNIAVQSASGEQIDTIADEKNLLDKLIGYPDPQSFPMLASIDRYGDTTFNRLQIDRLLKEWESLFGETATPEERNLLQQVKKLIELAKSDVHQYLIFIGD